MHIGRGSEPAQALTERLPDLDRVYDQLPEFRNDYPGELRTALVVAVVFALVVDRQDIVHPAVVVALSLIHI